VKRLTRRNSDLANLVKQAQSDAEASAVDDKYKPALFYYLLTQAPRLPQEIGTQATPSVRQHKRPAPVDKDRASAPAAIRSLYDDNFFNDGKTIKETSGRLARDGYHFGYETTKKALQRAQFLRAEGKKGSRKFFQRYPPK
jgi:hypothetical protein